MNKSEICNHGAGLVKSYCKFAIVRLDLTKSFVQIDKEYIKEATYVAGWGITKTRDVHVS